MFKSFLVIFFCFAWLNNISAQVFTEQEAKSFIVALLNNSDNLQSFIDSTELQLSQQLGITYLDTKHKFLIANNIETSVKQKLLSRELKYTYHIKDFADNYNKLILEIPKMELNFEYFFHNSKLISKPHYYSKNWRTVTSKFFTFHISDTNLTNSFAINNFDAFVDSMMIVLNCSNEEITNLEQKKIHYFLCKDKSEIKRLTNYSARGLYFLAFDYIISTFNSHYHEVAHLLMNYKLQRLELFTLPLLQEGFAVAYGGRGGKEPNVILNMGSYLISSNFIDYNQLLSKENFYKFNVSLSYPVAGLYVKFLIKTFGITKFLELYKQYSANPSRIDSISLANDDLPDRTEWIQFVKNNSNNDFIILTNISIDELKTPIAKGDNYSIYENGKAYIFKIKNSILISVKNNIKNYKSPLFTELYTNKKYENQKYAVMATANEVSVYNFHTNNLVAKYVKDFSLDNKEIRKDNDLFLFAIRKKIFNEAPKEWEVTNSPTL